MHVGGPVSAAVALLGSLYGSVLALAWFLLTWCQDLFIRKGLKKRREGGKELRAFAVIK